MQLFSRSRPGLTTLAAGVALTAVAGFGVQAGAGSSAPRADAASTPQTSTVSAAAKKARPNVLLVTVDDMTYDDLRRLPRLKKLMASTGATFTNHVAPTPLCVPARASLLTGQYAVNHGAKSISGPSGGARSLAGSDGNTLPVALKKAGYHTSFFGKYLNGYGSSKANGVPSSDVPPGWSKWRGSVDGATYNFSMAKVRTGRKDKVYRKYSTNVWAGLVNDEIRQRGKGKKPWYINVNYVAPHHGGPKDAGDPKTQKTPSPEKKFFNSRKSANMVKKKSRYTNIVNGPVRREFNEQQRKDVREAFQQRLESLTSVVNGMQRHVKALRKTGQLKNTYIVFVSDNGYMLGEHNRVGKLAHYRESLGVPMLVRGPGITGGRTVNSLTAHVDLPVTIAALAGTRINRTVDGIDLRRLWKGDSFTGRVVPITAWAVSNGSKRLYRGVRVDDAWTYVKQSDGNEEMYDLRNDPLELTNVAGKRASAAQRARLRTWTDTYDDCAGNACDRSVVWK